MTELVDTIVVGGGQAGLAMSYCLKQVGREHVIFERARVAENWRSARWDSLVFQFPSWSIKLPGHDYHDGDPDGFAPKDAVAGFIESYASKISAPLRCGVNVISVRHDSQDRFAIDTTAGSFKAVNVVIATGSYHRPIVPAFSTDVPARIFQIHSRDYKNPHQLPPGSVLIVGSGASGVQIAEELHESARQVFLSVGRHDKAPRRYRGKDLYWWLDITGIYSLPLELQPELRTSRILITGAGGGHDIDLRRFAARGITLVGRLRGIADSRMFFAADLENSLEEAEKWFVPYKARMDAYAETHGLDLPPASAPEPPALAFPGRLDQIAELDLDKSGIATI
ncbi:MAG: NAD(P)-binding domain-containing protein, partial [Rhizobiales bacterium]|nr:NAD(P)-binding domain-containing protein [Hyphomicrobiales bacterium]